MSSEFPRRVPPLAVAVAMVTLLACSPQRGTVRAAGQPDQTAAEVLLNPLSPRDAPDAIDPAPPKANPLPPREPPPAPPLVIPSGTMLRVRLSETLDTKKTWAGQTFGATLDQPIVKGGRVVVPSGTSFTGTILRSKRSGRFRGRAQMELTLVSFQMHGHNYRLETRPDTRVSGSHKKRNWWLIGGGTAGGAGIGAMAGGGTGALIGAGVGAVAGTTTALFTGRKNVKLPVETPVVFSLRSSLTLRA